MNEQETLSPTQDKDTQENARPVSHSCQVLNKTLEKSDGEVYYKTKKDL